MNQLRPASRMDAGALVKTLRSAGLPRSAPPQWDLSQLDQVIQFNPADMLLQVETGLRLGAAKDLVEERGLWLPLDSNAGCDLPIAEYLDRELSLCWLSQRYGTARDWITRMSVLDDAGVEVSCGANVVKNVAGYQLAPLYVGAHGCLGPILTVSFRLLPLPESVTRIRYTIDDLPRALIAVQAQDFWGGVRIYGAGADWRLEGFTRRSPEDMQNELQSIHGAGLQIETVSRPPREGSTANSAAPVRLSVRPSQLAPLVAMIQQTGMAAICYPGAGIVLVAEDDLQANEAISGLVLSLDGRVESLTVDAGTGPRWHVDRPGMARVKKALDPEAVFGAPPAGWL